jgi:hypothetical protein
MLPGLNPEGELPVGVHTVTWPEFRDRFCGSSLKRAWLAGRLEALLELAESTGRLRRVFVWGSFMTAKVSPGDLDVLLIMDAAFEVDDIPEPCRAVFDSGRAKVLFQADVFWARESIGEEMIGLWLETYQTSRSFRKRGIVELVTA